MFHQLFLIEHPEDIDDEIKRIFRGIRRYHRPPASLHEATIGWVVDNEKLLGE